MTTQSRRLKEPLSKSIVGTIIFLVIVLLIAGLLWIGFIEFLGNSSPFSVVSGTSMEPTLHGGDVVVLDRVPFNQLQNGDIIVFRAPVYNTVPGGCSLKIYGIPCYIIHRIVAIELDQNGSELIQTKGDNNQYSENGVDCIQSTGGYCGPAITQSDYVAKVIYRLQFIGLVSSSLAPPYNYLLIVLLFGIAIWTEFRSRRYSHPHEQILA